MTVLIQILGATLMVTTLLAGLIAVVNAVTSYQKLRGLGAPRPGLVLWRRFLGIIPPMSARATHDFDHRQAWVTWDLRWLTGGETLARVTGVDPETGVLGLELAHPIVIRAAGGYPAIELRQVEFVPRNSSRCGYGRAEVYGSLLPALLEDFSATAQIVVYPRDV